MSASQYARLVPKKYRSKTLPKIDRPWRPRVIAWAGPSAFYPNRFYEIDKWYKARIDKPERVPEMHIIDPAEHIQSLEERLTKAPGQEINIGFKKEEKEVKKVENEKDRAELERKARHMELKIDLEATAMPNIQIYKHFKLFEHLFGPNTFFENTQEIEVNFGENSVYNGNVLTAESVTSRPEVEIESIGNGGFNTILMVNLDGNAFEKRGEVVQWVVANIPDGEGVSAGQEVVEYMQPLPFYGTGYHRVAFVVFRHSEPVEVLGELQGKTLENRIIEISQFYKANEEKLTPSAIRFFQTSYDESVKKGLHQLGLKSPLYEYQYNAPLKPKQKEFPEKPQPFDLYMDMFRDPKDVEKEVLEKRLEKIGLEDVEPPKWVDIDYNENKKKLPGWLHTKMLEREGTAKAVYENK